MTEQQVVDTMPAKQAINTFLEVNFEGVEEPKLFAVDEEANLTVVRAEMHQGKNSEVPSLHCLFKSTDRAGYQLVHCYFPNAAPNPDEDTEVADKNNQKMLKRKRFFEAFNVDTAKTRIDLSDPMSNALVGRSGWCVIGIEVDDQGQYPDKNAIKRFVKR